jgi:hypothetical protein
MKIMRDATYESAIWKAREEGRLSGWKGGRENAIQYIALVRSRLPKTSTEKLDLLRSILIELDPVWGELDEIIPRRKIGGQTVEKVIPDMGEIGGSDADTAI